MNSLKVKILTDHQEIHITFAFQITGAVGGCRVGAQPLQLLMMFPLITVFMIKKKPVELAWVCLAYPGLPGELTSNWENHSVHPESWAVPGTLSLWVSLRKEAGPSFHCGVRLVLVKSLCPWNTSDTDSHMKNLCLLIYNLKIFCPCFWQINEVDNLL